MNEATGENRGEVADAAYELFLLGQKTVRARAVLAALEQELVEVQCRLGDEQQIEQLIEANQQLVLAMLTAQLDASTPVSPELPSFYQNLREANEALLIATLSAQSLQASAEHALEQQRAILTTVAHEIRNPLTPISMIAARLSKVPSAEIPRLQALIETQVRHLSRLIEDILDVSRATTGKLRLERRNVDVTQILQQAVDACSPVMTLKKQLFSADFSHEPLMMSVDPTRLAQVLHNLLANATKYTPPQGVIDLSAIANSGYLTIRVVDNGIGITAKALPHIFDPYVQDAHAVGFNGAGLGIGLTVVRELVEAHGGTVTGKSEGEGKGSEFEVTLPLWSH